MNKRFTLFILLTALLGFLGFAQPQNSPDLVVEKYLEAVRAGDYDKAYTYISRTDDTIIEWLELIRYIRREAPESITSLIDMAHSMSRQQISKTTIDGCTAMVEVDSIVLDMEEVLNTACSAEALKAMFEYGVPPMKERHGICELAVEDGLWRITCVRGVSAGQAAELATDLAEKILGKEDAAKLAQKIEDFQKSRKRGT
ncbi:MAG: hypothetical protein A2060_06765 [Planctomycetes bacterium GWA2_50_13]|nr:MAG: hypothetical protein A2060_06765 [Planctomycetes bacterium GWA2_50_13]OHB92517.1 MAG: hypothetical protein A3E75_03625 [Planctomycetes bacterium RIFCSPHIGHO2_12_FULL_51_37]OHB95691.1 MAG: hypothetical protein A3I59_09700 [Planctomycetes bacterium RIFCSPLOWO2_02_FULL_50_16]OHC05289.1 MAG: hypothetical protein A3G17_08425 [Planctomycetes bacterium RIFCSPLOWO2_12_FULL_50_35]HCN20294.1 hypothetical protein [Planctomycetia bacterium]